MKKTDLPSDGLGTVCFKRDGLLKGMLYDGGVIAVGQASVRPAMIERRSN